MDFNNEDNREFSLAADYINLSNQSVFLSGKAGTGKTTFLKFIKESCKKNIAVVAPTGVAAINAGASTIHSFFNLPFHPFIPQENVEFNSENSSNKLDLIAKLRFNREKKEILQQLELLIIDEISMVRCDTLDAIDTILRYTRNNIDKVFGGVQVLFIGDLFQLPPVIKDEEWQLLKAYYNHPYFFNSKVIAENQPVYIELKKVYRQSDQVFIDLLNKVRNNKMDEEGYGLIHSRLINNQQIDYDKYITLTTHNQKADVINISELGKIKNKEYILNASIEGIFSEQAFPVEQNLILKVGARVMFVKNDSEKIKRYYNGKIGTVTKIEEDKIWVECTDAETTTLISLSKETWKNIRYAVNPKSKKIEEEELGSFTQYPLRLAWAITIHKSQGLTFDNALVDAAAAFASGQVYVALSRCRSLDGLLLKSSINHSSLRSDERIVSYIKTLQGNNEADLLSDAIRRYQKELIKDLFNFENIETDLAECIRWNNEKKVFPISIKDWLDKINSDINILVVYSRRFESILNNFFSENIPPADNLSLKEKVESAAKWYINELEKLKNELTNCNAVCDNRQLSGEFTFLLKKVFETVSYKRDLLDSCIGGFSVQNYQHRKSFIKKEVFKFNAYAGAADHVSDEMKKSNLYHLLKSKRNEIAEEKSVPVYMVCSTESLQQMATLLPGNLSELGEINGMGPVKLKQYGKIFLSIIEAYCEENEIEQTEKSIVLKPVKKKAESKKKPDTKLETFKLYKEGISIKEIGALRNLTITTIEGHLVHFIETGDIKIDSLIESKTQGLIKGVLSNNNFSGLTEIKNQLPENISYAQIKWMIASIKNLEKSGV